VFKEEVDSKCWSNDSDGFCFSHRCLRLLLVYSSGGLQWLISFSFIRQASPVFLLQLYGQPRLHRGAGRGGRERPSHRTLLQYAERGAGLLVRGDALRGVRDRLAEAASGVRSHLPIHIRRGTENVFVGCVLFRFRCGGPTATPRNILRFRPYEEFR